MYSSRPEFIYYFDPDLDIQAKIVEDSDEVYGSIKIGFFEEGKDEPMAGVKIYRNGSLYQGYWKDDKREYFYRKIWDDGDSYTVGYKQGEWNGKGEWEWADGSREIAYYVDGKAEGAAKYYDKDGHEEDKFYINGELVEQ